MQPLAHIAPGEWAGLFGPAVIVLGAVLRGARGIMHKIDANLEAIRLNSLQNIELAARVQKIDVDGSAPVQALVLQVAALAQRLGRLETTASGTRADVQAVADAVANGEDKAPV